ncbi:MAG TPA: glycosyltransferase family 4 protein [Terriglobia bacterium]|nr:glycosyltransferase family 4 protein [Terriglobia bacterium]
MNATLGHFLSTQPLGHGPGTTGSNPMNFTVPSPSGGKAAPSNLAGKRVAMVTFSTFPGDPRPRRAVNALLGQGMTVDLICLGNGDAPRHEILNGMRILRFPLKSRRGNKFMYVWNYCAFILFSACVLARRSFQRRYDMVHIHNMPDVLVLSALVPKALGSKVLLDMHDPMPELMKTIYNLDDNSLSVRLIQWLEKWSIGRADFVLTVNAACKRIFASRSCPQSKIEVVMNSPDEQAIPIRSPHSYKKAGHAPPKPFVIMYHGSLVERNGLGLAVDALVQVRRKVPGAEIKICTVETPYLHKVMDKARRLGLEDRVHFLGSKRAGELGKEIESCDLGIVPNQRNAFTEINTPNRIFEFLSMGKPVIAPRTRGVQDYFSPDSLFFFEAGNADDLARMIEYVAFHSNEAIERVERGQQVYLKHTWSRESGVFVGVVERLLNGRRPRLRSDTAVRPGNASLGESLPNDRYS